MTKVREIPDTPARQPGFFVSWWEIVFHIRDGEQTDVTDIIEHVDATGNFTLFRDGERIGAGHHVEFTVDPDGFTNVQEVAGAHRQTGRELAVYRFSGDVLEACKASDGVFAPSSPMRRAIVPTPADHPRLRIPNDVTTAQVTRQQRPPDPPPTQPTRPPPR